MSVDWDEGYKKGKQDERERVKELKEELKKASENNDWEYAHDDNSEDGFKVMSGTDFIKNKFQEYGIGGEENDK